MFSRIGAGILVASAVGAAVGWCDQWLRHTQPGLAMATSAMVAVLVLYVVALAPLGLLVPLVAARASLDRALRRTLGVVLGLGAFVLVAGWLNVHAAGSILSGRALLFDGLSALGALVLGVLACRVSRRASARTVVATATVVLLVAFAAAIATSRSAGAREDSFAGDRRTEGPDLLVVLFDALRADHTSVYGYERRTTPHLEGLARRGTRFDTVYAPSSWTKPSVATLFTGLYPASHGNHRIVSRLPQDARTVPEILRGSGYHTGVFAENSFVSKLFGYARGVDRMVGHEPDVPSQTVLGHVLHQVAVRANFAQPLLRAARSVNRFDPAQRDRFGEGREMPEAVLEWIDALPDGERFFAYVHLMKPHAPYVCPPPFDGHFGEPSPAGSDSPVDPPHVEGIAPFARAGEHDEEFRRRLVANYDERILYGDHLFSRILEGLRERGRDPVVLAIADHGEEFGEHGLWDHGHSLQEGVVRVPFLLSGPGEWSVSRTVEAAVRLLDLPPTLLDLAGLDPDPQFDGRSVLDLIRREEEGGRPAVLELDHGPGYRAEALVSDGLKLVRAQDGDRHSTRVFDLRADPSEDDDLARPGEEPLLWMEPELEAALRAAARQRRDAAEATLDPETEERLRALGYIH